MRIGNIMIDTDAMSAHELGIIITELGTIYTRKLKQKELYERLDTLIAEAEENKFAFVDDETGRIWDKKAFVVADMA